MSCALDCRDITVSPGETPVLRRLSLHAPAGSRTVLVGPSGAGKTTLLRAVSGLTALDDGDIRLGGRSLRGVPAHRRGIAIVFQEPRLLPHLSVVDNVALPLRASGIRRGARRAAAAERLAEVGLAGFVDRRVTGLSGGEQHRVALARALCAEPDLLLLDEPLSSLDPNRREELRRLIVRVQAERRLTTLIVTHDRSEAAELGQSVALMLEGCIVQHDDPETLFQRPASAAVARFFGATNVLRGMVSDGLMRIGAADVPLDGPGGEATAIIRPEHIRVSHSGPLRGLVTEATFAGTHVRVTVVCDAQRLEVHAPTGSGAVIGEECGLELPREHLWRLPDNSPVSARD